MSQGRARQAGTELRFGAVAGGRPPGAGADRREGRGLSAAHQRGVTTGEPVSFCVQ